MLHIKFHGFRHFDSTCIEEISEGVFIIYVGGSHLCHVTQLSRTNTWMLYMKSAVFEEKMFEYTGFKDGHSPRVRAPWV